MPRWGEATGETPANADDLGLPNITVYQALQDIYIYIWVNYNDLTATEPWNHG